MADRTCGKGIPLPDGTDVAFVRERENLPGELRFQIWVTSDRFSDGGYFYLSPFATEQEARIAIGDVLIPEMYGPLKDPCEGMTSDQVTAYHQKAATKIAKNSIYGNFRNP